MAGKIQLTPDELQSQATEMQNLESEYSTLFAGVSSDLKSVNGNWSPNLSNNFEGKINSAQKSFTQITQELMNGSKVANTCAVTFESVDSELSKLYCDNNKKDIKDMYLNSVSANDIQTLQDAFNYIDEQYDNLPMWAREHLKSAAKEAFKNGVGAYEITQMIIEGDFEGAIKKFNKTLSGVAGKEISKIALGVKDLSWDQELYGKYVVNSIWGGIEAYKEYWQNPSLTTFGNIVWSSTVGSALETIGDKAYGVVSHIPIISDWYENKGAHDMGSMFNVMYTEWTTAIFGNDIGQSVSIYYADNGGLFKGLVNGFSAIKDEVDKACEREGGLVGVWLSGWNSIFD